MVTFHGMGIAQLRTSENGKRDYLLDIHIAHEAAHRSKIAGS